MSSKAAPKRTWFDGFLDFLEKACNKLPVPAIMFFYLFIIIAGSIYPAMACCGSWRTWSRTSQALHRWASS